MGSVVGAGGWAAAVCEGDVVDSDLREGGKIGRRRRTGDDHLEETERVERVAFEPGSRSIPNARGTSSVGCDVGERTDVRCANLGCTRRRAHLRVHHVPRPKGASSGKDDIDIPEARSRRR